MGYTAKHEKQFFDHVHSFPNECLENNNWVKIIYEYKPFCNI